MKRAMRRKKLAMILDEGEEEEEDEDIMWEVRWNSSSTSLMILNCRLQDMVYSVLETIQVPVMAVDYSSIGGIEVKACSHLPKKHIDFP
jgi:hypothetical protein